MTYNPQFQNLTTGIVSGCIISANVDTLKYDISSGVIAIEDWVDPECPRLKMLAYAGVTGQTPPTPTTKIFTRAFLIEDPSDDTAAILEEISEGVANDQTRREKVELPIVIHQFGDGVIQGFSDDMQVAYAWSQGNNDINHARKAANVGNIISSNGTNLSLDKSSGTTSMNFINALQASWPQSASTRINSAEIALGFVYQAQSPAGPFVGIQVTTVDPDNYDLNGTVTALANNKWTIQRFRMFGQSDTFTIDYGQEFFSSQASAEAAVSTVNWVSPPNAVDGVVIAYLVVKKGTTDLSDISTNTIINVTQN
jgi:hypothetical protein